MAAISQLINDFLANEWELWPVKASSVGLTQHDERLDDMSAEAFRRRDDDAADWMRRFEAVPDDDLQPDEQIDRDLVVAMLRGRLIQAEWQGWRRDPLVYSAPIMDGLFTLFLHRLRPEGDLVDAAVARLEQVPRALEQGKANLDPAMAPRLFVERGLASARGGGRYLRELLPEEAQSADGQRRLRAAGAVAADALAEWVSHLERLAEQASGDWVYGEERYTRLLRERESLAHDARSLREMGQAEYDRLDREMAQVAREADGSDDWRAVLERANQDHPETEQEMRETYAEWTERARTFLVERGLVSLPEGESCRVDPSPVFMRPVLGVAFYIAPPTFAETMAGYYFVPYAPDGASADEVQKRLASNSFGSIPSTSVHEAYPGHHWHLAWAKQQSSPLRNVLGTPYFVEGWALYAERLMREQGFFTEPMQVLYHLEATIFRAARIVVDTSLHLGEMSFEDAVQFMVRNVSMPEPTARAEVGRYCWWPTQASSYLTGCLEILAMRDRYVAANAEPGASAANADIGLLRRFHDRLAGSGRLPLGLAERALNAE
ncbi:MAG TPA: DUF885 domain-containing protein [Candidatus Limnocylindrales bacterium]|nr:DUF885 domain-containing protein [Candidatus Limnocylindrales bacterium]